MYYIHSVRDALLDLAAAHPFVISMPKIDQLCTENATQRGDQYF